MTDRRLHILQVNTADLPGGAERISWNLMRAYRDSGHRSRLVVGRRRTDDDDVAVIAHADAPGAWRRLWWTMHQRLQPWYGKAPGSRALCRLTHRLAEPGGWLDARRGIEDFHYPGAHRLLDHGRSLPDVVHCHNLHGGYFDLRAMPALSSRLPVVVTLHDAWLLSGHCAHSFDCDRWQTGCGECPDLSIPPAIRRDATAYNWRRKRDILAACRLHVATPSRWLMDKVEQSILMPAAIERRVIPNGVDTTVFKPGDQPAARAALGVAPDAAVLMFSAFGVRNNVWKDYETMRGAVARLAEKFGDRPLCFLAVGEDAPTERIGGAEIRFIPHMAEPTAVAKCYQAADIYIHATKADTFPNSVIEALACGVPVVATAVGGIPEQIRSLMTSATGSHVRAADDGKATGILTPPGDPEAMAEGVWHLLGDASLLHRLGKNAARDAKGRFDLRRQADAYLDWYREMCDGPPALQSTSAQTRTSDAVPKSAVPV